MIDKKIDLIQYFNNQDELIPNERAEKDKPCCKYVLSGLTSNLKRGKTVFERGTLKIVEMDVLGSELFRPCQD